MRKWSGLILALVRRGLPVLAVYALVLQAFLAGATPLSMARDGLLCSEIGQSQNQQPLSTHDCLCLAHCAQAQAPAAPSAGAALPAERVAHILVTPPPQDAPSLATPDHARPGARAPPHA